MKPWIDEALNILRMLAGQPAGAGDWAVFAGSVVVLSLLMLKIMGLAVGNANAGWISNGLIFVLGGALALAALTAGRLYLAPLLAEKVAVRWIDIAAGGLGVLLLAVPLMCVIQRVRYLTALVTIAVTGVTVALAYLFIVAAWQGARGSSDRLDVFEQRTEDLNEQIQP